MKGRDRRQDRREDRGPDRGADGEFYKNTPVTIQVRPGAVKIIVP